MKTAFTQTSLIRAAASNTSALTRKIKRSAMPFALLNPLEFGQNRRQRY